MANKKIITSITAVVVAGVMAIGGTFAWQSISQSAVNQSSDFVNPGGRLHNDLGWTSFNETNSDVYVENFADDDIFARVRLGEYFEVVMNKGVADIEYSKSLIGTKETDGDGNVTYTYAPYVFDEENINDDGTYMAAVVDTDSYMDLAVGNGEEALYYMPTFNKNKDSLLADLNGTYKGELGEILDRKEDVQYNPAEVYTATSTTEAYEVYDDDTDKLDEVTEADLKDIIAKGEASEKFATYENDIAVKKVTHTAAEVGETKGLISIEDWLAIEGDYDEATHGGYWVYDTDGWVYWSSPIKAGKTTGLLINGYTLNRVMNDTWYYAIDVDAQFVTANDSGKNNNTGFYDTVNGSVPSPEAEQLLEKLGVGSGDEEEEEEDGVTYALELIYTDDHNAQGSNFVSIAKGDSVKVTGVDDGETLHAYVWGIGDSNSLELEASDYTFKDGIFKLAKSFKVPEGGCVIALQDANMETYNVSIGYVAVGADSDLVVKDYSIDTAGDDTYGPVDEGGEAFVMSDVAVVKVGDEINVTAKDGTTPKFDDFTGDMSEDFSIKNSKRENLYGTDDDSSAHAAYTYENGKLTVTRFYGNGIVFVETDDYYYGILLIGEPGGAVTDGDTDDSEKEPEEEPFVQFFTLSDNDDNDDNNPVFSYDKTKGETVSYTGPATEFTFDIADKDTNDNIYIWTKEMTFDEKYTTSPKDGYSYITEIFENGEKIGEWYENGCQITLEKYKSLTNCSLKIKKTGTVDEHSITISEIKNSPEYWLESVTYKLSTEDRTLDVSNDTANKTVTLTYHVGEPKYEYNYFIQFDNIVAKGINGYEYKPVIDGELQGDFCDIYCDTENVVLKSGDGYSVGETTYSTTCVYPTDGTPDDNLAFGAVHQGAYVQEKNIAGDFTVEFDQTVCVKGVKSGTPYNEKIWDTYHVILNVVND